MGCHCGGREQHTEGKGSLGAPLNTSLAVRITIDNQSSMSLVNVEYPPTGSSDVWGRWSMPDDSSKGTQPPPNILAGSSGWAQICGRSGSSSGAEAWIKYGVGEYGVIQFNFSCPASDCNTANADNSSPVIWEMYTSTKETVGRTGADTKVQDYENNGTVPCSGHPLAILYIIRDAAWAKK